MTAKEFLQKIDSGYKFSEDELSQLFFELEYIVEGSEVLFEDSGDGRRWSYYTTKIVKVGDRFFAISGDIGLTESQENCFDVQPFEVQIKYGQKKIIQLTWEEKECKK